MGAGFRTEVLLCIGIGLLLAGVLRTLRPAQRRALIHVLVLLALCALAEGIAIYGGWFAAARTAAIARHAATLLAGVAIVRLGMLVLFHLLGPELGLHRLHRLFQHLLVHPS